MKAEDPAARFETLRDEFLEHIAAERNLSPHSCRAYAVDLADLGAFYARRGLDVLTVDTPRLRNYLGELSRAGLARATISRRVSCVRTFYRHLVSRGLIEGSPAASLRAPRKGRSLPRFLEPEVVTDLVTTPAEGSLLELRDRAILETLYSTGARVSELVGLSIGDLDFEEGVARVHGKGGKDRLTSLGSEAAAALRTYLGLAAGRRPPGPREPLPVFLNRSGGRLTSRSVGRVLQRWRRRLGLPENVTPHTLRHSFATHMLAAGANLRDVQELLGHASVASTQIYTHVTYEHLRDTYERTHPRA